jgi:enoyl-CoA hydratase/carnithine racemase
MSIAFVKLPTTLTSASFDALDAELAAAIAVPEAHAIALIGAGDGAYCRGMDLASVVVCGGDLPGAIARFAAVLSRIGLSTKPVIAMVDGDATGGGLGLAAACDVVLATFRSRFALPEALFGLVPGVVMPVLLERMPTQKARLLAITGASRSASWALAQGLVDEVVDPDELGTATQRWARELGRAVPSRIRAVRSWAREVLRLGHEAALTRGADLSSELAGDAEVRERVRAFVEEGRVPWLTP